MDRKKLGKWGEALAEKYLQNKGVKILERNVYSIYGEMDLIGLDGDEVVIFEVKTRSSNRFGYPEESVDENKLQHLIQSAEAYFQKKDCFPEKWRVDVIAITGKPSFKTNEIKWYKNVL